MKYLKAQIIIGMVLLLLVGTVVAITETRETEEGISNSPGDNWLGRIISQIQFSIFKTGDFTIYGRELECEIFSSQGNGFKIEEEAILTAEPGEAGFINWFRGSPDDGTYSDHPGDSRQFMREDYIEYGKSYDSTSFTCDAGAYWNNDCYWEFYLCPFPCYSDADCDSDEECDKSILSQVIDNAGVCKEVDEEGEIIELTHKTKVYECSDGEKTLKKTVNDGDLNFCRNPDKNNYLIPGVGPTGVCFVLEEEPKICTEKPEVVDGEEVVSKSVSLTKSEWETAPPRAVILSMCQTNNDCAPRVNHTISCIFTESIKNINVNSVTEISKTEGGLVGVCFSLSDSIFGKVVGIFADINCVNSDLVENPQLSGTCRASPEKGEICDFLEKAAFFGITGDECTDGGIIIGGGLVLLFVLFSRLGGYLGRFEYDYEI